MKDLQSCIDEMKTKKRFWHSVANRPKWIKAQNTTKEEAQRLASYFEGQYDALCHVLVNKPAHPKKED